MPFVQNSKTWLWRRFLVRVLGFCEEWNLILLMMLWEEVANSLIITAGDPSRRGSGDSRRSSTGSKGASSEGPALLRTGKAGRASRGKAGDGEGSECSVRSTKGKMSSSVQRVLSKFPS